ncbi:hypothetical protein FB45DRAFT_957325 [Roridomyces roridus]|uniref:Zn(2)-C6 fungal-type domain-containing protein n=1 Tax=Roridomyces roridus TaxID=1738132 RepID=A0AAD7F673_9AGAR|nr:hypothetical protein FB45DRAFT_957325 [Roridomyces roridus]
MADRAHSRGGRASSSSPASSGIGPDPLGQFNPTARRRRAFIACTNCRRRKIKCVTDAETDPCDRCVRKGLGCEYVLVGDEMSPRDRESTHTSPALLSSDREPIHPSLLARGVSQAHSYPSTGGYTG